MKNLCVLILLFFLAGCGGEITGTISVKGNVPHAVTRLTTEDGKSYVVTGPAAGELARCCQGKKVRLAARIVKECEGRLLPGEIEADAIIAEMGE